MENNKNKTRKKIAIDFGRDRKRAFKVSQDEQNAINKRRKEAKKAA